MLRVPARSYDHAIDRFWETVPPLWNFVRSFIRARATAQFEISVEQFHVLRHVRRGVSMSDLAAARNISRQSTQDRRQVELAVTDEGNHLLDTVFKETREWMRERIARLNRP